MTMKAIRNLIVFRSTELFTRFYATVLSNCGFERLCDRLRFQFATLENVFTYIYVVYVCVCLLVFARIL